MWLFTPVGFFSIVQKPGEELLCIRARSAEDLTRLRGRYLKALGPTKVGGGTDYPCRAWAARDAVGAAMVEIVASLDYSNFKNAVAAEQGHNRASVYHDVWHDLLAISNEPGAKVGDGAGRGNTAATAHAQAGLKRCFGGVLLRGDELLLRRPTGGFGGYGWTFAKGGVENGESPEQTALREVLSETGVEGEVVGALPGWFASDRSATRFFVMRVARQTDSWDESETAALRWVTLDEAERLIDQTPLLAGRRRDRNVLLAVRRYVADNSE